MKKLWIAFAIAMAALMIIASPVFANGGDANADVECGDIDVTNDSPAVGTTITFTGTVTITATATRADDGGGDVITVAGAWGQAYYMIRDPEGYVVAWGFSPYLNDCVGTVLTPEDYTADASQPYTWEADVYIDMVGEYIAMHGGYAGAYAIHWVEGHYAGGGEGESRPSSWVPAHWEYDDWDCDCCCVPRIVLAHSNAPLATGRTRPILTILTSEDHELYFPSDGWGDPTTDDIVYNDGTWQVEIADGTKILLDGVWHRKTWIEVDDQGNVIGRYGYDGHIIAEEIALSSPITITKVG
jgi:uncharacterized glyoxalase superfamily protein PhnB